MNNCIFCKIRKGEIKSEILYIDDDFMIIKDIEPQAKIHLLAIPAEHKATIDLLTEQGEETLGRIMGKISKMQKELGLTNGYRLIINQGEDAKQTVKHIHIHILGGETLRDF